MASGLMMLWVSPTAASAETIIDRQMVWADYLPNFNTNIASPNRKFYGSSYPLELGPQDSAVVAP